MTTSIRPHWFVAVAAQVDCLVFQLTACERHKRRPLIVKALGQAPNPESPIERLIFHCIREALSLNPPELDAILSAGSGLTTSTHANDAMLVSRLENVVRADLQRRWTLSTIERKLHVRAAAISSTVRRAKGMTLNRYIALLRVQEAIRVIRDRGYRVDAAASCVGYRSKTSLYRSVKLFLGTTPAAARGLGSVHSAVTREDAEPRVVMCSKADTSPAPLATLTPLPPDGETRV